MNGVLNILKPTGMTSFDVVAYLRSLTRIKKIGHTGTLDPGAAGVLPVCIGSATKAIEYLMENDKIYRAELSLGISTDTQDSSGKVIKSTSFDFSIDELKSALKSFEGRISQVPPMYSAVKVKGKRLYELAREGKEIERQPRQVEVYSIGIVDNSDLKNRLYCNKDEGRISQESRVLIDIHCSKGTYIRTICHDIGETLGCGGHMSFLLRLKAGQFHISSAITLEEAAAYHKEGILESKLIKPEQLFNHFKQVKLNSFDQGKFQNGVNICIDDKQLEEGDIVRVTDFNEKFIALGEIIFRQGNQFLKSKKFFIN